eukprot:gb/GECG01010268.1/.p1 GENE.gb/GECG01010268.1/~~gb/GECG01010268.1/.p1  ORF type:complete len:143 (+),score=15.39 gb/GECG01010268.1/:1-429(+)
MDRSLTRSPAGEATVSATRLSPQPQLNRTHFRLWKEIGNIRILAPRLKKTAACYKENQQDKTSRLQPRDHPRSFRLRTDTGSNPGTVDTESTDSSQEFLSKLGENAQASCTVDGLPLLLKLQNYDPGEPQSPLKSRKGYFRF